MTNTESNVDNLIQKVSDDGITLNINGEEIKIGNNLDEFKQAVKSRNVSDIKIEQKIYNIEHINEANFGIVKSKKVFTGGLTKELIHRLKDQEKVKKFLAKLHEEDKNNWDVRPDHLNEAQEILEDSYVWVIGWELRRLFAIGKLGDNSDQMIDDYIKICFSTYRITLQLINYLFISVLWDLKKRKEYTNINADIKPIRNFFTANRKLKLSELRMLFKALLEVFKENNLEYPIKETDLGNIDDFLLEDSEFNKACIELEKLKAKDLLTETYGLGHCHTAEISLAKILAQFGFLANSKLFTIKKIEYEKSRSADARYVIDLNILTKNESDEFRRRLYYKDEPDFSYSVSFRHQKRKISLFPFLLDYNALVNASGFQLFFYQYWDGESGLNYYSIESEKEESIHYRAAEAESILVKDEDQKNDFQKKIRLDLVTKQFKKAMNTILDENLTLSVQGKEVDEDEDY